MPNTLIPYLALVPFAAVTLGLAVTLVLFLSVKMELQRNARRERKRVDEMLERLNAAAPAAETVFVPVPLQPGFNINRRVHAGRLLRKGEDAGHVAAALGVPRAEVELLARVQAMTATRG